MALENFRIASNSGCVEHSLAKDQLMHLWAACLCRPTFVFVLRILVSVLVCQLLG
jgi:hypothetical protein